MKRVVSIGAHALDAELMGGPYLIKAASRGDKCTFVHMTRGERGNKAKDPAEYGSNSKKKCKQSQNKWEQMLFGLVIPLVTCPQENKLSLTG